jgi:hypothetical protein
MLEAVASGRVRSPKQIADFCKCTLLMALNQHSAKEAINKAVYAPIKAALEWLGQNNLIESVENGTVHAPITCKHAGCRRHLDRHCQENSRMRRFPSRRFSSPRCWVVRAQ